VPIKKQHPARKNHLAGIIPLANLPDKLGMHYHPSLASIKFGYTAVQAAVYEAAWAGCNTIWIVCNDDVQPLVRHLVGEWIYDPAFVGRSKWGNWDKYPGQIVKQIPIFYTGLLAKDIGKRDCYAYSIVHGADMANKVARGISQWAVPNKFYVSFPMGIYNPKALGYYRRQVKNPKKSFGWRANGKTAKDGYYTGFAFTKEDLKNFKKRIQEGTGVYTNKAYEHGSYELLPIEERNSARFFSLDKVLQDVIFDEKEGFLQDLSWFYKIDRWRGYRAFLTSYQWKLLKHPGPLYTTYREFNQIGVDEIEFDEEKDPED